jgi:hypothetical protein
MNDIDYIEILEEITQNLSYMLDSKESTLKLWLLLGEKLGLNDILPYVQVVSTPDDNGHIQPIMMVASPSKELSEYLGSQDFLTEKIALLCLEEIKKIGH